MDSLTLYLDSGLKERIKRAAAAEDRSVSQFVARVLAEKLPEVIRMEVHVTKGVSIGPAKRRPK